MNIPLKSKKESVDYDYPAPGGRENTFLTISDDVIGALQLNIRSNVLRYSYPLIGEGEENNPFGIAFIYTGPDRQRKEYGHYQFSCEEHIYEVIEGNKKGYDYCDGLYRWHRMYRNDDSDIYIDTTYSTGCLLQKQSDGTYLLTEINETEKIFDASGKIIQVRIKQEKGIIEIRYIYDTQNRIIRIESTYGTDVNIEYENDMIVCSCGDIREKIKFDVNNRIEITNAEEEGVAIQLDDDDRIESINSKPVLK